MEMQQRPTGCDTSDSRRWYTGASPLVARVSHRVLLPILALVSFQILACDLTIVDGRIEAADIDTSKVWIGVFSSPLSEGSRAHSWTPLETKQFRIEVPKSEEVVLLALRKNSVPLVKTVALNHIDSDVVLNFERGETLQGNVVSDDGFAIPNAELSVACSGFPSAFVADEAKPKWKTNSEGAFKISGLTIGECTIEVLPRPGMMQEAIELQIRASNLIRNLVLTDICFVSGHVVDHQGRPVLNALVNAYDRPGSGWFETSTTVDGYFYFGPFLKGKTIHLLASHDANGSTRTYDVVSGKHDIVLRLSDLTRVVGMVVDSTTGEPVEEFALHARRQHSGVKFPHSESEGQISAMVDTNSHSFALEAPGFVHHWEEAKLLAGIEYDLGTLELEPAKTLTGRVYDASSGNSIPGARIHQYIDPGDRVVGSEGLRIRYLVAAVATTTDDEGEFSIGPLPFDDSELMVHADGYESLTIAIRGDDETLDIAMSEWQPSLTRIRGVVQTKYGEPVKGMVTISSASGGGGRGNNNDGTFDRGVFPGSFTVYADTKFGRTNVIEVDLQEGEIADLILTVDRMGRLEGDIEGLQGGEEVTLRISNREGQHVRYGSRWSNGAFLIEGIPLGKYSVAATSTMNREITELFEIADEDGEAYVDLIFRGESRLYGSVEGGGIDSQEIHVLARARTESATLGWSEVFDDSTYDIRGLEDGDYSVAAYRRSSSRSAGFGEQLSRSYHIVVHGDIQLDITLRSMRERNPPKGSFSVSGSIYPNEAARGAIVNLYSSDAGLSRESAANVKGEFQFKGLPGGSYSLLIVVEGYVDFHETLYVGPSIEGHQIVLEPTPQGTLYLAGKVQPTDRVAGAYISIVRESDRARIKSVEVNNKGQFIIEKLNPGKYLVWLDVKGFERVEEEIVLETSIDELGISLVPDQP